MVVTMNFKVGDKVKCISIAKSHDKGTLNFAKLDNLVRNKVYTVVNVEPMTKSIALKNAGYWQKASRFEKVPTKSHLPRWW